MLQLSLNRIFRSRWGVALTLAALVVAVVGVGRLVSGGGSPPPIVTGVASAEPTISADPSQEDSVLSSDAPSPSTKAGTAEPEAVAYAFAAAWVDHRDVSAKTWYSQLLPNATKRLAAKLNGADPAGVPAERVIGRPKLVPIGDNLIQADVTVNSGTVILRLVAPGGHWLVDGIDWNPS
jgi:hypothetical protein